MDESIITLKRCLEEKTPTLLLGAGFSCGGVNANGKELPLGNKLVNDLYQYMFVDNPPCKDILEEDVEGAKTYKERGDLKGLCGLLRDEGRVNERNQYLSSVFSGATIDDENKIFNITSYRWNKIFSIKMNR